MLKTVGASALKDIVGVLKKNEAFFSGASGERKKTIFQYLPDYPAPFVSYLSAVSESDFLSDLEEYLKALDGLPASADSGFLNALIHFISHELGGRLDQLDSEFFFSDYSARQAHLKKQLPREDFLSNALLQLFLESTYQELSTSAHDTINELIQIPTIVVQSPVELDSKQRKAMRESFLSSHSNSFVEYQINPQLIGGMRVFVQGEVVDHSWLGKVQALTGL